MLGNILSDADASWTQQDIECLDVGIIKYGIWTVKTNNTIQFRDHSLTTSTAGATG